MEPKKHDLFTECFISALDENGKYASITNNLKHVADISYDNIIDFDDNTTEKYLLSTEQLSFDVIVSQEFKDFTDEIIVDCEYDFFIFVLSSFSNNWKKMHKLPKTPKHKITNMCRKRGIEW